MMASRGFEEVAHTADVALRVWAEDLPSLFAEAALGMNSLAGVRLAPSPRIRRTYKHAAADKESLLVAFLSELVFNQENENLGWDAFRIRLEDSGLEVQMAGAALASVAKPIKAVTFHNLHISQTARGYEAELVFDV